MGSVVFADAEDMSRLNALTHPPLLALVKSDLAELNAAQKHELAVLEAAVYFLVPSPPRAELIITVTAPAEVRERRLVDAGLVRAEARSRIERQADFESAFAAADIVINNSGTLADLEHKVESLLAGHMPPPA